MLVADRSLTVPTFLACLLPLTTDYFLILCLKLFCIWVEDQFSSYCAVLSLCRVQLFATLWTVAHQAPLSMGILQARILEWAAMPSSRGFSQPRDQTQISCIAGGFFTIWATREGFHSQISWTAPSLLWFDLTNTLPSYSWFASIVTDSSLLLSPFSSLHCQSFILPCHFIRISSRKGRLYSA